MTVADLDDAELMAFIGLAKQVIRADKIVSEDEKAWLVRTAEVVGADRWRAGIRDAQEQFDEAQDVRDAAAALERPEAREAIYDALMKLAEGDEYVYEEAVILDWVARLWDIGDHVPMVKPGS